MKPVSWLLLGAALGAGLLSPARASAYRDTGPIDVKVWTDGGQGAVYHDGDPLGVYVRVSRPCFAAAYDVDTRGDVRVLYPRDPLDEQLLRPGHTYRFPRSHRDAYYVEGPPGIEYLQVIASSDPLYVRLPWAGREGDGDGEGWDESDAGDAWLYHAAGDPFAWCGRVNRLILGDDPDAGTGYTSFYVERRVAYPRFLCSECHAHPYIGFDPYLASCPVFEIRVSAGWVWRSSPYRYGYTSPYYRYYRRDDCPPRWAYLPRSWSSADRHRIHEYFGDLGHRQEPGNIPPGGGTAADKDRDVRFKEGMGPNRGTVRWDGRGGGGAPRRDDTWKDRDVRERSRDGDGSRGPGVAPPPRRGGDEEKVYRFDQKPGEATPRRGKESWISELLRGAVGGRGGARPGESGVKPDDGGRRTGKERAAPAPPPNRDGPARQKDQDRRSK